MVLLPGLMGQLATRAPRVRLVLHSPGPRVLSDLEEGALDLAWGLFREAPGAFRRRVVFRDDFVSLVRHDHPSVGDALDLDRFVGLSHVLVAPRGQRRGWVDRQLEDLGLERHIALVVPSFLAAPLVVEQTDLILTLPRRVAERHARSGKVRILDPPVEIEAFAVHQLWHDRLHADPGHVWLRERVGA